MPATWPTTLPQQLLISGNKEEVADSRLLSQTDTGPGKMRARSSATARPLSGSMMMTEAQTLLLDQFIAADLNKGVLPFTFPVTRGTGTWLVRFAKSGLPAYVNIGPDSWSVSLGLEILP